MIAADLEFDPDDNYAERRDFDEEEGELAAEALIWQLLLLINPDDEEAAAQQLTVWQELISSSEPDSEEVLAALRTATDWRSCFFADQLDATGLIECIDELSARWNVRIDWDIDDSEEDLHAAERDLPSLLKRAHEQLREHGYTLWIWQPAESSIEGIHAGWITRRWDDEAVEVVANALGIEARPAAIA